MEQRFYSGKNGKTYPYFFLGENTNFLIDHNKLYPHDRGAVALVDSLHDYIIYELDRERTDFVYITTSRENPEGVTTSTFFVVSAVLLGFRYVTKIFYQCNENKTTKRIVKNYRVKDTADIYDVFINKDSFIARSVKKGKHWGAIIGDVSGLLAKPHAYIERYYDYVLAKENFGGPSNGKNLLHIVDTFSLDELGIAGPIEKIEYWVDADTMQVIKDVFSYTNNEGKRVSGDIYIYGQQSVIKIQEGIFDDFGGEYPHWAKSRMFDKSDLDATVVFGILGPIMERIPLTLSQMNREEMPPHILRKLSEKNTKQ